MLICPECGSNKIFKVGSKKDGIQKYDCGDCHQEVNPTNLSELGSDGEVLKENLKLAKSNQKLQDKNRIERKSFRELVRLENTMDEFMQEFIRVAKDKKIPTAKLHKTKNPVSLIFQLSDTHFNELVDIIGNKYDFKVASQRLYKYADKIIQYLKVHNIKNTYLVITGDLLNSDRRLDEVLSMSTNRAKATLLAVKLISQFISDINQYANVNIISVTGNESRIREEYTYIDALATDNFDFMIYEMLKLMFNGSKSVKFINGDSFDYVFNINGKTFLVCHGNTMGTMKVADVSKVIAKWSKKGINIDMILCGHLHETKITDTLGRSGSLVGNNAYADVGLNLHGSASQNMYIVYKDGSVDSIRVDLQDVNDKNRMYEIDKDLEAYNAKSVNKTKQKTDILKIVI